MNLQRSPGTRGPSRTTRGDWIRVGLEVLIAESVDSVKVLTLAEQLGCARSSFYWYFKNRSELLDALLDHWAETNTKAIMEAASQPAETINFALGKLYVSWLVGKEFNERLDFAVRDWARRSATVRRVLEVSEQARIESIAGMFRRFGYEEREAEVRGRIVYFTQIGYSTVDQHEDWRTRVSRGREYLLCMTGVPPTDAEVDALTEGSLKRR
jgi:AcrR family transcriptional regulator